MEPQARLKIFMLTHSVYARDTRIKRYAEYLGNEGHEVDIVCLADETGENQSRHPKVRVYPLPVARHRREGLGLLLDWLLSAFLMFLYTTGYDFRGRYDLVHIHNMPDILVFCALFPKLRGCPVIFNVHDPAPELARSKLSLPANAPLIRVLGIFEQLSIRFSSHVITATPAFADILVSRGAPRAKISVVTNAADERFFSADPDQIRFDNGKPTFTLLYVGTVALRYGLQVCIQGLPVLRKSIPGIRFMIIPKIRDEGRALDYCRKLAQDLNVGDLVTVSDPVPLEDMPIRMRESDIGIYPALRDCHMDVALSLKIPEMARVGLPILSTRLTVLEELYGDDGIAFFPSGDVSAFTDKVMELYRSPKLRETFAKNALARSTNFTWQRQYVIYKQVIETAINNKHTFFGS